MNVKEKLQMTAWGLIVEAAEMYTKILKADSKLKGEDVDDIAEIIELALSIIREECNNDE